MAMTAAERRARYRDYWCDHGVERGKCLVCDGAEGFLYFTGGGTSYHSSPECSALVRGQKKVEDRNGSPEQIQAVRSVRSTDGRRECRTCRPTAAQRSARGSSAPPPPRPPRTTKAARKHRVGSLTLVDTNCWDSLKGATPAGTVTEGDAHVVQVTGPGIDVDIADIRWRNGERDVRIHEARLAPPDIADLVGRCRVGISRHPKGVVGFRMRLPSRGEPHKRPTPRQTDLAELDKCTGVDVRALLVGWGASAVGRRSRVLGDKTNQANELYVTFHDPEDQSLLPIVACCVTHLLPTVGRSPATRPKKSSPSGAIETATTISAEDTARLIKYLDSRVCAKCRVTPIHKICGEATDLLTLFRR